MDVHILSLNLYFSYSKNHRVFENSGPQYFALGNGLTGALLEGWTGELDGLPQ